MAARYQHLSPDFLADAVGGLDEGFGLGEKDSYQNVTGPKVLSSGPTVTTTN